LIVGRIEVREQFLHRRRAHVGAREQVRSAGAAEAESIGILPAALCANEHAHSVRIFFVLF